MKIEGPKFRFWTAPDMSEAEWLEMGSALCRILVAGPPEPPGHRRAVAVRQALAQYQGAPTCRAKELERKYKAYLAAGWLRERDMESLPHPRSAERVILHRIARLNDGAALCWRTIYDIATMLR